MKVTLATYLEAIPLKARGPHMVTCRIMQCAVEVAATLSPSSQAPTVRRLLSGTSAGRNKTVLPPPCVMTKPASCFGDQ